ncbi:hypothetical protein DID88_001334 [Monilinia fructigena]|uniref:Uncharacterized protein n=1 Tax=Monilinia fructigena TaxID=38457 RepID=A0A395IZJ3_9HELO|nr:hypothetical protein DID88_001334 [Monilinia fructigena]
MELSTMNPFISFCLWDPKSLECLKWVQLLMEQNHQPGCSYIMRLPEDRSNNTFRMGSDGQTKPQEVSCSIPADTEQASGRTALNSRTEPFPQTFGIDHNNWRLSNEHPQARDLTRGLNLTQSRDTNSNTYSTSGTCTNTETGLSPNTRNTSNHPTPNSTTPSDSHSSNIQHGQNNTSNRSYETSPAPNSNREPHRIMDEYFHTRPSYSSIPADTAPVTNTYSMPEMPGRSYTSPGSWGQSANTGLTPVGEGVFRHMMGLGPAMDPMDIWEGVHEGKMILVRLWCAIGALVCNWA